MPTVYTANSKSAAITQALLGTCKPCCGAGSGSGSGSGGPYSYTCCQEEGIATDWTVSGTVKGCSYGYWQSHVNSGWVEVTPKYGGLRAAYNGNTDGYIWEEIFCADGSNDFSVPMTVFQASDCDISALMIQMSSGGVPVGPTLTLLTKYRAREIPGGAALIFDPTVDTGISLGPPVTYVPGSDYRDTSDSVGYAMESEIYCYCDTDRWAFLTYSGAGTLYAPTVHAFDPYLGATGQYFLTEGIRCFESYVAPGPPFDYDPSARNIGFLPDNFLISPA